MAVPGSNAHAYNIDIGRGAFYSLMERAAHHDGYIASDTSFYEVCLSDGSVLSKYYARSVPKLRVYRRDLIDSEFNAETSLLACKFYTTNIPFNEVATSSTKLVARRVRQLHLRMHNNARLLFETSEDTVSKVIIYSVRVEMNHQHQACSDLRRTVQNTIRIVMLNHRPTVMKKTANDLVQLKGRESTPKPRNIRYNRK